MQGKVGQQIVSWTFLVAVGIAFAREIRARNAHAHIVCPVAIGRREGLYQQVMSVLSRHLHQVITGRISQGKPESVHRLVFLFSVQRDEAVGCSCAGTQLQGLFFQQYLTVSTGGHHLYRVGRESAQRECECEYQNQLSHDMVWLNC